ncbi:metal-dependent transcriptional regulator [Capnocytophaga leadbetteri]|jgi:iron (metal) dependent repressor, dtxR family|uniref:metal-dependent transcriptional regulator n=1 Tax=Capnocytophaga leadbetteri TaxID=327575 RepID=UPI0026F17CFA|nr:metal-dependent transcriptional regulator [Capnocytophaga leadbetteri]
MTLSEENYLKTIFLLYDERKTEVTTTAIADLLYTKASSVTDMLKKLSDKGLINYRKYQGVTLTPKGTQKAIQIVRKHRLWEVFLVEKLNFSWDEVHEIAEELEHIQSDKLISRLDAFLGFPERDPHGDPIPNEQGVFTTTIKTLLSELNDGDKGVCIAVKNTSKEFLVYLNKVGIALENEIEIISKEPFDNSMTVLVNDQKVNLSAIVCRNIYVAGIGGRNKEIKS